MKTLVLSFNLGAHSSACRWNEFYSKVWYRSCVYLCVYECVCGFVCVCVRVCKSGGVAVDPGAINSDCFLINLEYCYSRRILQIVTGNVY